MWVQPLVPNANIFEAFLDYFETNPPRRRTENCFFFQVTSEGCAIRLMDMAGKERVGRQHDMSCDHVM